MCTLYRVPLKQPSKQWIIAVALLAVLAMPHLAFAKDDGMERLAACNRNGGIFENGQCIPPAQYKNVTQKRLERIQAEREQRNRRICATIKDPCAMPICKKPTTKCPDNLEAVRKMMPPPPDLPRPALGRPAISNLTNTGLTAGGVNGGLTSVPPMGGADPAAPTVPTAPAAPQSPYAGGAVPMTPPAVAPVASNPNAVAPGGTGQIKNRLQGVPQQAPAAPAEVPPEKDSKSGGGLPSWLRFGQ